MWGTASYPACQTGEMELKTTSLPSLGGAWRGWGLEPAQDWLGGEPPTTVNESSNLACSQPRSVCDFSDAPAAGHPSSEWPVISVSQTLFWKRDGSRAGREAVWAAPTQTGRAASLFWDRPISPSPVSPCIRRYHGHICLLHLLICSLHNIESGKDTASTDRSFPSWKKKQRKKETSFTFFTFWSRNKDTIPCARLPDGWFSGRGRPCLWSGHAPRSKVLLDGFLVNAVGSSRDSSFGKKDVLERSVGLHPRHISSYKTENMHVSGCKKPSLFKSEGLLLLCIPGGWGGPGWVRLWPKMPGREQRAEDVLQPPTLQLGFPSDAFCQFAYILRLV